VAALYLLFERSKGKRSFFLIFRSPGQKQKRNCLRGRYPRTYVEPQSEFAQYLVEKEII
jgi:hypothetical protein